MAHERFVILEHTSEVGVVGCGPTLPAALAQAGLGLMSVITDLDGVGEQDERRFAVAGSDAVDLLVGWLSELVYVFDVERLVFRRFALETSADWRLTGVGYGEPLDRRRHRLKLQVKAVTYHQATVARVGDGWRAQVYLDV